MLIVRFYYPEVLNSIERVNVEKCTFGRNVPIIDREGSRLISVKRLIEHPPWLMPCWLGFKKNWFSTAPHLQLPCLSLIIAALRSLCTLRSLRPMSLCFRMSIFTRSCRLPDHCLLICVLYYQEPLAHSLFRLFFICSQYPKCFLCALWNLCPINSKIS